MNYFVTEQELNEAIEKAINSVLTVIQKLFVELEEKIKRLEEKEGQRVMKEVREKLERMIK